MLETVKALCALNGVSGWEDDVRDAILSRVSAVADRVETDVMGNLYAYKSGRIHLEKPVMLCAHMDEVGLIVTGYRDDGNLRFDFIGGVDRRVVLGKRVFFGPAGIPGVIGLKAVHMLTDEEKNAVPRVQDLYVDIGAENAEEARERVPLGWRGAFDPRIECFGDGYIKAKALDDRVGCATLVKLLESELPADVCCAFTVQEEVGCRGAAVAVDHVHPDVAFVLEGTTAADIGGVEEGMQICRLGQGVVIPFMDAGTIYNHWLYELTAHTAEKHGIPWQTKQRIAGGTDASAIQRGCGGALVQTVSAPLRNIHSPASIGKIEDMEQMPALCRYLLEEIVGEVYGL